MPNMYHSLKVIKLLLIAMTFRVIFFDFASTNTMILGNGDCTAIVEKVV